MPRDLEDFLRRAAQRRAENETVRREQQQRDEQASRRPRSPEYTDRNAERQAAFEEYDDEDEQTVFIGKEVDAGGETNLGTPLGEAAARQDAGQSDWGQSLDQSDQRVAERLKQTFDHEVGNLDDSPGFAGQPREGVADRRAAREIIRLLQSPQGVRQALMLREILDRPRSRW
jgi:hypothetical protein